MKSFAFKLALILFVITQSCKKSDQPSPPSETPPQLTLTEVQSDLPKQNLKSCAIPNSPIKGDNHILLISYTSNTDLKKYTVELKMIISYPAGSKNDTLIAAHVDSIKGSTIYHNLCSYMSPSVAYIDVNCQVVLRDPATNNVVLTSNTKTGRIKNPVDYPALQQIKLTDADIRLIQVNNCQTAVGTGSTFQANLFYSPNLVLSDYYIEVRGDYQFNDGSAKSSFLSTPKEINGIAGYITQSWCTTFGSKATAENFWFTMSLYQKDDRGKKVGSAFLTTNTIGPYTITKPAGAMRMSENVASGSSPVH